jgi:peptide/nickel transport system substrate-binding protein
MFKYKKWVLLFTLGVIVLAACQSKPVVRTIEVTRVVTETEVVEVETVVETIVVEAEPEEELPAPKELIICQAQEPDSLYWYGTESSAAQAVFHGVYENDITNLSYNYQAQGIHKIPSLADGDAAIRQVEVNTGDVVVNARGDVVILEEGVTIVTSTGEEIMFDNTPVVMAQLVVNFALKQRFWSDGMPVTADDSVYSFELQADPDTPGDKFLIERTASYIATGNLSVQWVGVPGYLDSAYFTNFWKPLPRHAWEGLTPTELLEAEESSRLPIGDGAFVVVEWQAGESIRLQANEFYYRNHEGLPRLDSVVFRFIPDSNQLITELLSGHCHIGTQDGIDVSLSPFLIEAEDNNLLVPYFQTGTVYEHIDFGINSWGNYGDGIGRPDWFEDVRVRQAITMCTDRQRMVDTVLYGRSHIIHSYIPDIHPLYPIEDFVEWPYDIAAANLLLDEAGFIDTDRDGVREDQTTATPFLVRLVAASGSETSHQLAQIFKENMRDCGIEVELDFLPASELFANSPDSLLFGRRFDLGQFAWPVGDEPLCYLYTSWQITGPADEINPEIDVPYGGWNAVNDTGWSNPEYDRHCATALNTMPGSPGYEDSHKEAQRLFAQNLPALPLFLRLKVAVARPEVVNFGVDPTQKSELWNLFEIDLQN